MIKVKDRAHKFRKRHNIQKKVLKIVKNEETMKAFILLQLIVCYIHVTPFQHIHKELGVNRLPLLVFPRVSWHYPSE